MERLEQFEQSNYQKKIDRANRRWAEKSEEKTSPKKQHIPCFSREFKVRKAILKHKKIVDDDDDDDDDDEVDYA